MSSPVNSRLLVFIYVYLCLPMFRTIFSCHVYSCLPMLTHVFSCLPMFTRVYLFTNVCSAIFTRVYSCLPMCTRASLPMFSTIYSFKFTLFTHAYTCLYIFILFTRVYLTSLPMCTLFTCVHLCLALFTRFYLCLPLFTRVTYVYHCLLVHVYLCLPMFTHVYLCLPLFTRACLPVYPCLHVFAYRDPC